MDTADFYARHDLVVLQLSAGKDSAACLKLVEPWLGKTLVMWVNPGRPYQETLEYMEAIQRHVPRFIEVRGEQPAFVKEHGYAVDLVPFELTTLGRMATRTVGPTFTSVGHCCNANLWQPTLKAIKESGATGVIRGERDGEALRSPLEDGMVHDGIEYHLPIAKWSNDDVFRFLGPDLPASYKRGLETSLDCANCLGYLAHNPGRLKDLRTAEPEVAAEIAEPLRIYKSAVWNHGIDLEDA